MLGSVLRNNSNQYEDIPSVDHSEKHQLYDTQSFLRKCSSMKIFTIAMVALCAGFVVKGVNEQQQEATLETDVLAMAPPPPNPPDAPPPPPFLSTVSTNLSIPEGVNIGSWLSLEDYFFAGLSNSVEVATPDYAKVAACLPPLHVGSITGPKWHSETDLFRSLMDPAQTPNGGIKHAIQVFAAHRASFIDLETDLQRIASLGVRTVRIPMSWCWTEKNPYKWDLMAGYGTEEELLEDYACVDPFWDGQDEEDTEPVLWPAVPKSLVEDILRACARAGLKASLDVHTLPGGTSPGTFSGVWPKKARFWTHGGDGVLVEGNPSVALNSTGFGIGHEIFRELVEWMEDLMDRDPEAFGGLRGLSPMNEPAHLSATFDSNPSKNFLPPLPKDIEDGYVHYLNSSANGAITTNYLPGPHLRVFYWFDQAIDIFRRSKLPSNGIQFQSNIIESIFPWKKGVSWHLNQKYQFDAIAKWWCATSQDGTSTASEQSYTTSPEERSDWAVLDMHHYYAWGAACSGSLTGEGSAYACRDTPMREKILEECSGFAGVYRSSFDNVCGVDGRNGGAAKLMSGEFSPASHHSVRLSCMDIAGLHKSYELQVEKGKAADIDMFYWSYKMPYGGSFKESGWSFSQLMYKFGVLGRPDDPEFPCDSQMVTDVEIPW